MKNKALVFSAAFAVAALLFFAYEFFCVKNPFFDPIPPYVLWGALSLLTLFWLFRAFEASQK